MMRRRPLTAGLIAVGLIVAAGLPAGAFAAPLETLMLDVHEPAARVQPTVVGAQPLTDGRAYVVNVIGTYSIVPADRWLHPAICGTPLVAPRFPTPGIANGRVGLDAELQFARTADQGCSGGYPRAHNRFQIDVGNGFRHVPAEGAPFADPTASMPASTPTDGYRYRVTGMGVPPRFRVWDEPAADNYGQLRITIEPAEPDADAPPSSATAPTGGYPPPPAAARCLARRVLRLRIGSGSAIAHARVTVNGWRWGRVRYGRRVTARLDLRKVKLERVRVRVRILTRDGRVLSRARTYGTCARRAKSTS